MYILNVFDVCFVGLFVFSTNAYNRISTMDFSLQNLRNSAKSKWDIYTPVHLKVMPTTSLSQILHSKETRHNEFDYIFYSQLKQIAPKLFRLFDLKFPPVGCDMFCSLMHRY